MTRLKADALLFLTALLWGVAFVAQKEGMYFVGACTFVALRSVLSCFTVLPLAIIEYKGKKDVIQKALKSWDVFWICVVFSVGIIIQQIGIGKTSVANAGFLTGLYVVFVPLIATFFYKEKISFWIYPAAISAMMGVFLLSGGVTFHLNIGDLWVLGCAVCFAFHFIYAGRIMGRAQIPYVLSFVQYLSAIIVSIPFIVLYEPVTWDGIVAVKWPIIYAGVISGGVGYTLQLVAQQYAPPSDTAVILSMEAVFAALAGWVILSEGLSPRAIVGCVLIIAAILLVECGSHLWARAQKAYIGRRGKIS